MRLRRDIELGNVKGVQTLNEKLARPEIQQRFDLLFDVNSNYKYKVTESELEKLLVEGHGVYWDYSNGRMKKYGLKETVENIGRQRLGNLDDVMFDFEDRL